MLPTIIRTLSPKNTCMNVNIRLTSVIFCFIRTCLVFRQRFEERIKMNNHPTLPSSPCRFLPWFKAKYGCIRTSYSIAYKIYTCQSFAFRLPKRFLGRRFCDMINIIQIICECHPNDSNRNEPIRSIRIHS